MSANNTNAGIVSCKDTWRNSGQLVAESIEGKCDNGLRFEYFGYGPTMHIDFFDLEEFNFFCFKSKPADLLISPYLGSKLTLGAGVLGLSGALFTNRLHQGCILIGGGWINFGMGATLGKLKFKKEKN